tara:strand:+ start:90 stop:299 length:210 start_codon:yes stop_codon:yes gene_type:complete
MKKVIDSSTRHSGLVLAEVLIILGAVLVGEYALSIVGMSYLALFIALPAIFIGLLVRSYFTNFTRESKK